VVNEKMLAAWTRLDRIRDAGVRYWPDRSALRLRLQDDDAPVSRVTVRGGYVYEVPSRCSSLVAIGAVAILPDSGFGDWEAPIVALGGNYPGRLRSLVAVVPQTPDRAGRSGLPRGEK